MVRWLFFMAAAARLKASLVAGQVDSDQIDAGASTGSGLGRGRRLLASAFISELSFSSRTCSNSLSSSLVRLRHTMRFATSCLAALGVLVQLVPEASAHGFVNLIKAGGKFYPGWDLNYYYQSNPPAVAGWSTTALDSGFVSLPVKRYMPARRIS
jgi:hypothetical protein